MSWFHLHRWTEVARAYTPPANRRVVSYSEITLRSSLFGMTNITLKCDECGDLKIVSEIGRV